MLTLFDAIRVLLDYWGSLWVVSVPDFNEGEPQWSELFYRVKERDPEKFVNFIGQLNWSNGLPQSKKLERHRGQLKSFFFAYSKDGRILLRDLKVDSCDISEREQELLFNFCRIGFEEAQKIEGFLEFEE